MNLDEQHYLQSVGLRIRTRREAQNLTQAQLGESCDLDRTFVGSVERGERNVAILNIRKIARALRIPVQVLLAEGEAPLESG